MFHSHRTETGEIVNVSSSKRRNGAILLAKVLEYLECPQYLRKAFFPPQPDLKFAGWQSLLFLYNIKNISHFQTLKNIYIRWINIEHWMKTWLPIDFVIPYCVMCYNIDSQCNSGLLAPYLFKSSDYIMVLTQKILITLKGLLNPLDSIHHYKADDWSVYREGVVTAKPSKDGKGSYVDIGLRKVI